jgi:plastocyanin
MLGNSYDPTTIHIKPGDIVEWRGSFASHPLVNDDGLWPTVSSGSAFRFSFVSSGSYQFHCQVHAGMGMAGQVIVSSP